MHLICDMPNQKCKGNDSYWVLQRKRMIHQSCYYLRILVSTCHGRKNDPNPIGHKKQLQDVKNRIENCNKKLMNRCNR